MHELCQQTRKPIHFTWLSVDTTSKVMSTAGKLCQQRFCGRKGRTVPNLEWPLYGAPGYAVILCFRDATNGRLQRLANERTGADRWPLSLANQVDAATGRAGGGGIAEINFVMGYGDEAP